MTYDPASRGVALGLVHPHTLQPVQFFHGTTSDITDTVLPGAQVGKANYDYDRLAEQGLGKDRNQHVFVSDHEKDAWAWASSTREGGRPRVYQVQPPYVQVPGGRVGPEFTTPQAKVLGQIDIPPPMLMHKGGNVLSDPVQGTLPPVNWRQFGGQNHRPLGQVRFDDENPRVSDKEALNSVVERAEQRRTDKLRAITEPRLF